MTYGILFSDSALKQLKKLKINVQERIISTLERIRIRPQAHVTKLVGDPGYRLMVGKILPLARCSTLLIAFQPLPSPIQHHPAVQVHDLAWQLPLHSCQEVRPRPP